ncbi:hypothetical protein ScSA15_12200 [Streptococcus canis]
MFHDISMYIKETNINYNNIVVYIYKKDLIYFVYNGRLILNTFVYICKQQGVKENEHNRT